MLDPTMLQRDAELAELSVAIDKARRGEGNLVLVSGSPGIGKTALLQAGKAMAADAGCLVLTAAASEFDRLFSFGLVHQLFDRVLAESDAARRERLFTGAASRAQAVLEPAGDAELPQDPGHAVLHGLFWLVANLADEMPVVMVVDDLHWADRASLRLLEYLSRRFEALPVLVVATLRPNEPGREEDLLLALEGAPTASVIRPRSLDAAAAARLFTEPDGAEPEAAFIDASMVATGGNPLLLRVLAAQARERGLTGRAQETTELTALAATELGVVVQRRLARLGDDAMTVATAGAVLGEPARLSDLAAVAELSPAATRAAADRLVLSELIAPDTWAFVHPLIRSAVLAGLTPSRRGHLHTLAARRLRATGEISTRVAVHLLAADPAGDPEAVATLRTAARTAAAEGAPEVGAAHLRRALEEPPAPEERAGLLLELGELEGRAGETAAIEHLTAALDAGLTGDEAARARAARGAIQLHVQPLPNLAEFAAAHREAANPDLRLRLEALLLEASVFHSALVTERAGLLAAGRAAADPSPVMLAHLAQEAAFSGRPAAEVHQLARRAIEDGELLRVVGPGNSTFNLLVHALRTAERPEEARALLDEGEREARRGGVRFADFFLEHASAYWHLDFGSVAAGVAQARTGLDKVHTGGFGVTAPALLSILAELLVEADLLDDAAAVVDELEPGLEDLVGTPFALAARGVVRRRQHRDHEAERDLHAAIEQFDRRGWAHAAAVYCRLELAELLGEGRDRDAAIALARQARELFARAELAGAAGAALRVEGLVTGGDDGLDLLAAGAQQLEGSPLRRQHGWALYELGAALRRAGHRVDAREPLRAALDVATRIEATRLARAARDELVMAGGRAVREALSGPASLTPAERRVAEMAAGGLSNREIAETLWVTRKTVEVHLGKAYGKLGIKSRKQLAEVMGSGPGVAEAA